MSRPRESKRASKSATESFASDLIARTEAWRPSFAGLVVAWQQSHGRHDMPWQKQRDPYRVWLSEIMLQQTQVSTVLGYYARFLDRFPTVAALAQAPLDDVLAEWAGLGYYSRARNLHRCAQAVVADHGGAFPRSAQELAQLPGIGPSTAAAIAAFCFDERSAILDGNVKRVLSRALGYGADLAEKRFERELWASAQALLPEQSADMPPYTQGLMDLGATICSLRKPACVACPLQTGCTAAREGQPEAYPVKTRKLKRKQRENWWLWLERDGRLLLEQRPATGVWAGLWSLPMFDSEADLLAAAAKAGVPDSKQLEPQPLIEHALTHFDWRLHPRRAVLPSICAEPVANLFESGVWVSRGELPRYGLPAPLKRLLGA